MTLASTVLDGMSFDGSLAPAEYRRRLEQAFPDGRDRQFFEMSLIRHFEQALLRLFSENRLFGTTHTSIGQECNAVGLLGQIRHDRDVIWSSHRCHGHFIAYSGNLLGLFAEIMGKRSGVSGGRGGSQHICYHRFYSNGIQGGITPQAAGAAYALKKEGAVAIAFIGDGTLGEGALYESLNLAALWGCPVIYVVEDNGIAQTTPSSLAVSGSIADRAKAFGIRSFSLDTMNVSDIAALGGEALDYVRKETRPAWLHLKSARLGPHSKGDDTRPAEQVKQLQENDPLQRLRHGIKDAEAIDTQSARLVQQAMAAAMAAPDALN